MIVVLTHNYPTEENPVAGIFVEDHAQILRRERGVPVKVLNYPFGEFPMTKHIRNPLKWPRFLKYFLITGRRIKKDIENCVRENDGQPVDIIAHWWFPNGTFAAKYFDNLHVICHGTDLYQLQKYRPVARWFAHRAGRVRSWQCVSEDLKRILLELYPALDKAKITVEPMPIGSMFVDRQLERDANLVISAGALIKRKKFDELIEVVTGIPDLKLHIYGQGPEQGKLEKLITDLGAGDRIKLAGQVTREELIEAYNRALLFVLLSIDEGFGLVLKEAQACGCKTMAYIGDGMADTGLDYPVGRNEAVAELIQQALRELKE